MINTSYSVYRPKERMLEKEKAGAVGKPFKLHIKDRIF